MTPFLTLIYFVCTKGQFYNSVQMEKLAERGNNNAKTVTQATAIMYSNTQINYCIIDELKFANHNRL